MKVEKGFNSDITVRGLNYHVQTEDWGAEKQFVVTRVFRNGAIVKTVKTPYQTLIERGPVQDTLAIRLGLREQHQQILDLLLSGEI